MTYDRQDLPIEFATRPESPVMNEQNWPPFVITAGEFRDRAAVIDGAAKFDNVVHEFELIASAFRKIAQETSYESLAKALLTEALNYCGATRGAVLLSEGGALLEKADASFPREKAKFFTSQPAAREFRLPADLNKRVVCGQETVVREATSEESALIDPAEPPARWISQLALPLVHQECTVGVLYLESERDAQTITPRCLWVMSMLASQAAVSFESVRLFEALRETNMWMVRGQQIGRIGSFRLNTSTRRSRGSRESYRILDLDLDMNPLPYEIFRDRVHPDDLLALEQALTEAISAQSPFRHEYRVVHRNGKTLHVVVVGQFDHGPGGALELEGIIADVTDQKIAEQALADARSELAQALRLASVGELAGSIIHEVNQPLTRIVMTAEACLMKLTGHSTQLNEARKFANGVIDQAYGAADVIAGLRSLVRDARPDVASVDLNDAVEEVLLLSRRELEQASVTLHTDFDRSLPNVEADRVQIQQVVLNLVRNAIEAMVEVEGKSRILTASSKSAGDHASITITDTGIGVSPGNREHLFDALYTTKGSGLGLGLSICRKIITAHGGRLWMEEGAIYGAAFTFMLPDRQTFRIAGGK
jgi:C4-dicarboxylate-specific signal transduction histidine kinase